MAVLATEVLLIIALVLLFPLTMLRLWTFCNPERMLLINYRFLRWSMGKPVLRVLSISIYDRKFLKELREEKGWLPWVIGTKWYRWWLDDEFDVNNPTYKPLVTYTKVKALWGFVAYLLWTVVALLIVILN